MGRFILTILVTFGAWTMLGTLLGILHIADTSVATINGVAVTFRVILTCVAAYWGWSTLAPRSRK